jgi:hypothetical protein
MAINFGSLKQQASAALSSAASQARNSVLAQASAVSKQFIRQCC